MKPVNIRWVTLILLLSMLVNLAGCGGYTVQAEDLMKDIEPAKVQGKEADDTFREAQMAFALELFRQSAGRSEKENVLVSPLSMMLVLAMTANGAEGDTKAEMEAMLGLPIAELNEYLYSYVNALPSTKKSKMQIANSIWMRQNDLTVKKDFLQANANYYGADAYQGPFDAQTLKDINGWVEDKTDGMIEKIIDVLDPSAAMVIVNTVLFDAKWDTAYRDSQVISDTFHAYSGEEQSVKMMHSSEYRYIADKYATGFLKHYKDKNYSFAALLPNEGLDVYDYISSLDGKKLLATLENVSSEKVSVGIPRFSHEYSLVMNDVLQAMGMESAFGADADFSAMAEQAVYIDEVLHKTYIEVTEKGTRAAAASSTATKNAGIEDPKVVYLDRPFVYMIIDNQTNLPIFMGVVTQI